jgi:Nuclease-related domain
MPTGCRRSGVASASEERASGARARGHRAQPKGGVPTRTRSRPLLGNRRSWGGASRGGARSDRRGRRSLRSGIRGQKGNIDHIAVYPAGVWVIDTKRYPDSRVEFHNAGGLFRQDERLLVGGRDRSKLVESMDWQVRTVQRVVDQHLVEMNSAPPDGVVVRPALFFVDSVWGLLTRRPFLVRGVAIRLPTSLSELLTRPAGLGSDPSCGQRAGRVHAQRVNLSPSEEAPTPTTQIC